METLREVRPLAWLLLAAGVLLLWALIAGWGWYRRRRARRRLVAAITATAFDHIKDVLVPDGMGGSYHVDFVLLTPRGLLVVDLRDVRGNVFGGDQMNEWTVMDGSLRSTFANPQSGLYDRVAAVKALAEDAPVEGRVVFTQRARFPKGLPKCTLTLDSLRSEFPAVDPSALAEVAGRYQDAWRRVRAAVAPSRLTHVGPAVVP